jgi:hypothetical protein
MYFLLFLTSVPPGSLVVFTCLARYKFLFGVEVMLPYLSLKKKLRAFCYYKVEIILPTINEICLLNISQFLMYVVTHSLKVQLFDIFKMAIDASKLFLISY